MGHFFSNVIGLTQVGNQLDSENSFNYSVFFVVTRCTFATCFSLRWHFSVENISSILRFSYGIKKTTLLDVSKFMLSRFKVLLFLYNFSRFRKAWAVTLNFETILSQIFSWRIKNEITQNIYHYYHVIQEQEWFQLFSEYMTQTLSD